MKILLVAINAKYIHSCPAVYSLCASCGHPESVEIAEFTINDRYQDILDGVLEREASVIGFSTYIWNTEILLNLTADIRRVRGDEVILFAGGPEASYSPERFLSACDFVVCGEGEIPFNRIMAYTADAPEDACVKQSVRKNLSHDSDEVDSEITGNPCNQTVTKNSNQSVRKNVSSDLDAGSPETTGTSHSLAALKNMDAGSSETTGTSRSLAALKTKILANVPGLVFRPGAYHAFRPDEAEADAVLVRSNNDTNTVLADANADPDTVLADANADLDSIPFPYKDLAAFENRIIYYESSRGCPFRCTYCLSSIDKRVRFRSLERVFEELQFFLDREVPQVKFIDRTFNCNHDRTKAIWAFLREHDNAKTNFHFEIGADLLDEEEMAILESLRPGQVQLEIGIQSTNPETLQAINRTSDLLKLFGNIRQLRSANNMHLHVDLIAGLPYEGLAEFAKSFNDVYALHADQLQLGFLKVLGGTVMQERAEEYDIRYSQRPPYEVLSTKWLTYGELALLRRISDVLEYYYNSGQFRHTLGYLEGYWESAFAFFRDLAVFYRQKGYDRERPAAARRYEVLEEFVQGTCSVAGDGKSCFDFAVFREHLRFDRDLHIHRSRRRKVIDEYDFGKGKVLIEIDYEHRDVITGESFYLTES